LNEIKIDLAEVNPQEFFGEQNTNIAKLRTYFPKIKIIARGNTLKAYGEESILTALTNALKCSSHTLVNLIC
jgi:phosphate starvation-inducible PhoH-like protein